MRALSTILLLFLLPACSTQKPKFVKENVCSNESLKYLKNPRNKMKRVLESPELVQDMANTSRSIQLCYEDFKQRSGAEEFNTCLVVGVNETGETEFYNFGSREVKLDKTFLSCVEAVTKSVPFNAYGSNYILIQTYQFYLGEL
ncbi:MAG: hypothetical protein ACLGHN_11005 [Bacteriovoracia bacterium]